MYQVMWNILFDYFLGSLNFFVLTDLINIHKMAAYLQLNAIYKYIYIW